MGIRKFIKKEKNTERTKKAKSLPWARDWWRAGTAASPRACRGSCGNAACTWTVGRRRCSRASSAAGCSTRSSSTRRAQVRSAALYIYVHRRTERKFYSRPGICIYNCVTQILISRGSELVLLSFSLSLLFFGWELFIVREVICMHTRKCRK